MKTLPPYPAPGDKITAELIRELIRCMRERQLLKGANYDLSSGPNGTTLKIRFPSQQTPTPDWYPWACRWNSAEAQWEIYLPSGADSLYINGSAFDIITPSSLVAAQQPGWYVLPTTATGGDIYINAWSTTSGSGSTISAELGSSQRAPQSSETAIADILVATLTGSSTEHTVEQNVVGAVCIGSNNGGALSGTVSFVGAVKYDTAYHQLQTRVDTLDLATGQVTQGQYSMITGGQAVPLSGG